MLLSKKVSTFMEFRVLPAVALAVGSNRPDDFAGLIQTPMIKSQHIKGASYYVLTPPLNIDRSTTPVMVSRKSCNRDYALMTELHQ